MNWLPLQRTLNVGVALALVTAVLFTGCDLLDVSNPNALVEEDLANPEGAEALKNGLLHALMNGTGWVYAPITVASDEASWRGSYESYRNFQIGRLSDPGNEITNNTFPELAEARWLADDAIERITTFESEGELDDPTILTKTYIYSALTRITIAEAFDNFVYSDKQEANPPIGEENMDQVFDEAIDQLGQAVSRARSNGNADLEMQALGLRARAKHSKAVWNKLNPPGSTPSDPLVSEALRTSGAVSDARAALQLMDTDYKARFDYRGPQITNYIAGQVNSRNEIALADPFDDLKTNAPDPRPAAIINDFQDLEAYTENFSPLTWLSAREMRLIIAEGVFAESESEARAELNSLRAMDNLPPLEAGDDFVEFVEHERRANLFLQGRRLNDMYRFGTESPDWVSGEDARENPGTLLPIPSGEIVTNPHL